MPPGSSNWLLTRSESDIAPIHPPMSVTPSLEPPFSTLQRFKSSPNFTNINFESDDVMSQRSALSILRAELMERELRCHQMLSIINQKDAEIQLLKKGYQA
jgi:hypothetical protein